MANYEKSTLKDVKERLEAGHYTSLTGALRGIGRMQGLSDRQKTKAQNLAREHFGETAAAAPAKKKTAKKVSKKKVSKKKVSKRKTTAKKAVAKKTSAKKAPAKKKKKASKKAAAKGKGRSSKAFSQSDGSIVQTGVASPTPRQQKLAESGTKIGLYEKALESLDKAKSLGVAESEVATEAKTAMQGLMLVVNDLISMDSTEPSEGEQKAAEALSKAVGASSASRGSNGVSENVVAQPPTSIEPTPPQQPQV